MIDSRTGVAYEILCAVEVGNRSFSGDTTWSFNSSDIFTWDIDYHQPRDLTRVNVTLLNENFEPVIMNPIDNNPEPQKSIVSIILKCYHRSFVR
jgi:hypothetical protein